MLDEFEDVISNPFAEMPEFFPKQINFAPVPGLPGSQVKQMEHKQKTPLKDKYWEKISKDVFEMATSSIPRPVHLTKILDLYILHQEKQQAKRKEEEHTKKEVESKKEPQTNAGVKKNNIGNNQKLTRKPSMLSERSLSRKASANSKSLKYFTNLPATNSASVEIEKRVQKLNIGGEKLELEELAKESKNILVRMPPYKKRETDPQSLPEKDTAFMKMLTEYAISKGFVERWKGKAVS